MRISVDELKAMRLAGQHLLSPAPVLTAAGDLCGVQAQFFGNAVHALRIRSRGFEPEGLIKSWTVRGTVHLFPERDLPLYVPPEKYRSNDWSAPDFWNTRPEWALTAQRQEYLADVILSALRLSPLGREALKEVCRGAGMTPSEEASMFHPWGGGMRQLAERGFVCYEPSEEKVFRLAPELEPVGREEAELELAKRYFTSMGPASVRDGASFFGVSQRQVRSWLDRLPVTACECGGREYFYIGASPLPGSPLPRCLFLAGFDQLMMGYDRRDTPFLRSGDVRAVFASAGIVRPTVLLDGTAAGCWKRRGNVVTVEPLRELSAGERSALEAAGLELWGDGVGIEL